MDQTTQKLNEPLVSILMLTYDRARHIGQAIESVLAQTYKNWRLVIIDDGSTDDTETVVRAFSDLRIAYVRHDQNEGLIARRLESLTYAAGTYVAVLDSDDYWTSPYKLEEQVAFLETNPEHVLVGTQVLVVDDAGNESGRFTCATDDREIRSRLLRRNQFTHSSVLIRRSALEREAYDPRVPIWEDYDLILRLGLGGKVANLPETMTAYRRHEGNISKSAKKKGVRTHLDIIKKYRRDYPHYLPALLKGYARFFV